MENGLKNIKKVLNMVKKEQKEEKVKDVEQDVKGIANKFKDICLNLFNE